MAESRNHASANTVRLAVEICRAQEPSGGPPLVRLHGGPGNGGIRLYSAGVAMSALSRHRDVVIYDQRGAGFSEPKLCPGYERVADWAPTFEKARRGTRSCVRHAAPASPSWTRRESIDWRTIPEASAANLIDLRRTLGYVSWDISGGSYGARLAQEAMVRDGQAIRSVVLSSPVARSFSPQAEQPLSIQQAFERLFAACRLQPSCRDAFPNIEQDFYATYDELTKSPVPVPIMRPDGRRDTVSVDGDRLVAGIRERIRTSAALGRVPLLLHELRTGDRLRAAREVVGDGSAPEALANLRCATRQLLRRLWPHVPENPHVGERPRALPLSARRRPRLRGMASPIQRGVDAHPRAQ